MLRKSLKTLFVIMLFAFCSTVIFAQDKTDKNDGTEIEKSGGIKETLAKWRIKKENEDYENLIKRGEEANKIADELKNNYEKNRKLSDDELKKLDKLEKILKKIMDELGADENNDVDDSDSKKLTSIGNAITFLQETSSKLLSELKKNTKLSISAVAIESSNFLMKIVRFIRFSKN